ncbi:alcohol acetyltransferase [Trametes polyzona]|nr:alcohol acetyltransferase [Trametes polyzona]
MTDTTGKDVSASSASSKTRKHLRAAGRFEHWFAVRAHLKILSWVVVSAKYHNEAGATLDKTTIFAALDSVVCNHVALASRLEYTSSLPNATPVWVRLPSVDLNRVVEFRDEDSTQLSTIVESMYAVPAQYPDDVPPWKLLVLRDGTVAFAFEHTFGDGQSGMAFHVSLLNALRKLPNPLPEHPGIVSDLPDDASLAPAMEDAIDVSVPFTTLLGELIKAIWPPAWWKAAAAWTGGDVPKEITFGASVRTLPYSAEEGRRLVELSRAHKTTLTGTLHTVALVVLSRLIRSRPGTEKYKTIATTIPISLRRYTGTPPTAFCNHISSLQDRYPILPQGADAPAAISAENLPWDLATSLTDALKREAPRSASAVGMLKFISGKYEQYLRGLLGKKRANGLELSNIGPFPVAHLDKPEGETTRPNGGWDIEQMFFIQSDATLGAAIMLNVAGAPGGAFGISVTSNKQAVDLEFLEEFVAGLDAGIRGLLASKSAP